MNKHHSVFAAFIAVFLFAGCLNYEQDVSLNPDGSGSMKVHYWMKVADQERFAAMGQIGSFNKDSVSAEFSSPWSKVTSVAVYNDTTDTTTHTVIELEFTSIDSLNRVKPFAEAAFSLQDGASNQKIFSQFIPPVATGFGFDGSSFSVVYSYSFPGEIITHNATEVKGKTLLWKYSFSELGKGKNISVTYRPFKLKETPYWIYVLSGSVLLIVLVFLFRRRRN